MKLYSLYIFSTCLAVRLPSKSDFDNNITRDEITTNIPQDTTDNIDETSTSEVSRHGTTSQNFIIDDEIISMEKQSRIIGGKTVRSADLFPSFVSIRKNGGHICGGVILDELRVLTAAHCRITESHSVFVGGIDYDGSDCEQNVGIYNVTNHPEYSFPKNDISVLQLAQKLDFSTSRVRPIEFGSEEEFEKVKNGDGACHIVGHGKIDSQWSVSTQLKTARQVYMSTRKCRYYSPDKFSDNSGDCFLTRDNDAGSQGCMGDSGGPLYCEIGYEMKLFGIASFVGNDKCSDGWTGWMLPTRYESFINSINSACPINGSQSPKVGLFLILALVTLFV